MTETTTLTEDGPKKMSLVELRKHDGPLFVENLTPMLITCNEEFGKDTIRLRLDPAGQPGSIDELPKAALSVKGFRSLIFRGDVRISTDEDMLETIEVQAIQKLEQDKVRQAGHVIDSKGESVPVGVGEVAAHKDLQEKQCLTCGSTIFQMTRHVNEGNPPLCPKHIGDASKFVPTLKSGTKPGEPQEWVFTPQSVTITTAKVITR